MTTLVGTIVTINPQTLFKHLPPKTHNVLQFLSVFSLAENSKTLLNTKSSASSINCLIGLKALSLLPIIFVHSLRVIWPNPEIKFLSILAHCIGILPTDTFFVVSGILCAKFYVGKRFA